MSASMLTDAEIIAQEHASCNAAIAELQKRIAELAQKLADEEFHAEQSLLPRIWEAEQALTAERQRRESAEAALRPFQLKTDALSLSKALGHIGRAELYTARNHFSRYASESEKP